MYGDLINASTTEASFKPELLNTKANHWWIIRKKSSYIRAVPHTLTGRPGSIMLCCSFLSILSRENKYWRKYLLCFLPETKQSIPTRHEFYTLETCKNIKPKIEILVFSFLFYFPFFLSRFWIFFSFMVELKAKCHIFPTWKHRLMCSGAIARGHWTVDLASFGSENTVKPHKES